MRTKIYIFCLMFMLPFCVHAQRDAATVLAELRDAEFDVKSALIGELESSSDHAVLALLKAMLAGDLYYLKDGGRPVLGSVSDEGVVVRDALTGEQAGVVDKRELKKFTLNNTLREQLRAVIARLSLNSNDRAMRRAAVKELIGNMGETQAEQVRISIAAEKDHEIRSLMEIAIALVEAGSNDEARQLSAISKLSDSLEPAALARLKQLSDGGDGEVSQAANRAIAQIEGRLNLYASAETVFFGLSLGSVLLLSAIGLAITFGVMGVINMAHGELMMIGAYTTYVVQLLMPNTIDYSLFVAVPLAFIVAGLVGIGIERGVIRFLYGRPLETLLATFGISLILQQAVRTIFSPLNRSVATPSWMSGSWEINPALSLTYNRLYIIIFSLFVFAALLLILKRTALGLKVRAVSQNRQMAQAMGVRSGWVDAMTFGLGSGIAGVAGVALSQLTNVGPNLGQAYIIDSFLVVVLGGVGNLWGTFVAAMSLGVFNKLMEPWVGAVLAKILLLVLIILFIQKRPRGLFPQRGRVVES
ncbi:MAG: urea ABC transporter permease subunit UrtB [Pseudomonadota bacterium]